jgi:tetratricopeptide (TPR) repeat protein
MGFRTYLVAVTVTLGAFTSVVCEGHEPDYPVAVPPEISDVGDVSFPVSCEGEAAQARFNRAVALLHHMTYEVAERDFARIAIEDPSCAMAHWGIAMTLIHPVWPGLPEADVLRRGATEIARARELQKTEREASYIEALSAFYDDWEEVDHWVRIARWDEAQTAVRNRYPDDDDALAFYAVVHIAAAPKDDMEYRFNREAGGQMEKLFARRPRHPGAVHYLIHAYDNPPMAEKALGAARAYDAIAPEVPHALHMPTHIFTRLGLWSDSMRWNIRSREAGRNLRLARAIAHSSDYLTYAYLQAGRDGDARTAKEELVEVEKFGDDFVSAYALAAVPARIEMELGNWQQAARLQPRVPSNLSWAKYPSCEAIVHFARGIGAARSNQRENARAAAAHLGRIARALEEGGSPYWSRQVRMQATSVEAWIAHAEGRTEEALGSMKEAAIADDGLDKHPVTPGAILPARELYADMLAEEQRWDEALSAYEATLRVSPHRFNSLAGAGWVAERMGNTAQARVHYGRLLEVAGSGDTVRPGLARARSFLGVKAPSE